jgi:hypothetical protein
MSIQDYGKGATITTGGGRFSDKTCLQPPKWTSESRDLAGKFAAGNHQVLHSTRSMVKISNPILCGSSSEASFRPLVSGRMWFSQPSPYSGSYRRHFLNLGIIQRIDTSPQE